METKIRKEIYSDIQFKKFCMYGFFKNLKFYEPYLIVLLISKGINLFQVGLLFALREIVINIFEIPSGVIADTYGKKRELSLCFIFYIVSFVLFFLTNGIYVAFIAMFFYGLGDAFRTGTHKAIIYSYLESKGWQKYKSFVYSKTRSVSLIGSSLSALIGIFIILNLPSSNYIFLASITPYLIDFFIILSYPNDNNVSVREVKLDLKSHISSVVKRFRTNKIFSSLMFRQAFFEASVFSVKDFIQPILKVIIVGSGIVLIGNLSSEQNLKVILGLSYALIFLFSSVASSVSYRLQNYNYMKKSYISLVIILLLLAFVLNNYALVILLFLLVQFLQNSRKPIFVAEVDEHIDRNERATILSVASQMKSIVVIVLAPLLGFFYDNFGAKYALLLLGGILVVVYLKTLSQFWYNRNVR